MNEGSGGGETIVFEIGDVFQKDFDDITWTGTITGIDDALYRVQYEDGDEEDLDYNELVYLHEVSHHI